jgi:hypothetical protein
MKFTGFIILIAMLCANIHIVPTHCRNLSTYRTHLIIKIPTRGRPEQFFKVLNNYRNRLSGSIPYLFLITCDIDDKTMNNEDCIRRLKTYPNLHYYFGTSSSKIDAYNRDLEFYDFNLLIVTSDDAIPTVNHYDKFLDKAMYQKFPDYDGVINFYDGHVRRECNTLPVIGGKYYRRFHYVYHPSYKSFYCDEELMLVSRILRKELYIDTKFIEHKHPAFGAAMWDSVYEKNEPYLACDRKNFLTRKSANFNLSCNKVL